MAKRPLHRSWSVEDTERLRQHILSGGSLARATVKFARTEQALREQAKLLGLKFATIRELRKRASGAQPAPSAIHSVAAGPAAGASQQQVIALRAHGQADLTNLD
jgi:hypothetical protein